MTAQNLFNHNDHDDSVPKVFETTDAELEVIGNLRQKLIEYYSEPNMMADICSIDVDSMIIRFFFKEEIEEYMTIDRKSLTWNFI